jgi:hypothetical protein
MSATVLGAIEWGLQRSEEGHRDYSITWKVRTDTALDGPAIVTEAAGLPAVGSSWSFENDVDLYAYCWPDLDISQMSTTSEPDSFWKVKQKFSTRPLGESTAFDNPLTQPPQTSGSFTKFTKQIAKDRNGAKIASSSHELYNCEIDESRPQVQITLTLASLPLTSYAAMVDTLNSSILWGLPTRTIKLSNVSWARRSHQSLGFYYEVSYTFDINFFTFDFKTWDHGSKVLKPGGTSTNPTHYEQYKDRLGENGLTLLNGSGAALTDGAAPVEQTFQIYGESNFLLLGIPAFL